MRHPAGRCGKEADTVTTPELAGLPSVPAPDGGPWRWGIRLAGIRLRMSLPALNLGNSPQAPAAWRKRHTARPPAAPHRRTAKLPA
jgi:hypothetical protein